MRVAYIQPIFAPDQRLFEKNIRSVESLKKYGELYKIPERLVFGGWGVDPYINEMVGKINELFPGSVCDVYSRNFGKAHVINDLYRRYLANTTDFDYILLADSDIVFDPSVPDFVERMVAAGEAFADRRGKEFGLMAPNQAEGNCHALEQVLANRDDFQAGNYKESVTYPNEPSGIAGGCWLTSRKAWDTIGGYRTMGVYAGEDAYYLLDVGKRGFTYSMCDSIHVIHPPDNDPLYNKWKYDTCIRDTTGAATENLEDKIRHADEFWASR